MRKALSTSEAPAAVGPYSQAVRNESLLFISGQLPINPLTNEMPAGIQEQTHRVMENIRAILRAAQLDFSHILKTTVYLSDMEHYQEFNKTYESFFGRTPPARACVQVGRLPKDALVEIEVIAGY